MKILSVPMNDLCAKWPVKMNYVKCKKTWDTQNKYAGMYNLLHLTRKKMINDIQNALNIKGRIQTERNWSNIVFYSFLYRVIATIFNSRIHLWVHYL